MIYSYPITEYQAVQWGFSANRSELVTSQGSSAQQAVDWVRRNGGPSDRATMVRYVQTPWDEAMSALEPHLDQARRVRLLLVKGQLSFVHSDYDAARNATGQAVEIATAIERDDLLAEATLWRGKALTWGEEPEEARTSLTLAVELARTAGRPEVVGEGLRYLAMVAGNVGDYPTSVDLATQARAAFARVGDTEMESAALAQLATTYFHMHRYAEAQEAFEATLPIFRRSGHRYREAVNTGNLASIALARGRLAEAARWADAAIELTEELEEGEASATYLTIRGEVAILAARFAEGEAFFQRALEIGRSTGVADLEADVLAFQVKALQLQRRHDAALALAREAVEASLVTQSDVNRGQAQVALGYAALGLGVWDQAERAFTDAVTLYSGLEVETREATSGSAAAALGQGRVDDAMSLVEPLLGHLDRDSLGGTVLPGEMLLSTYRVLTAAGDPRAATVLENAHTYLRESADEIGDPDMARGYLSLPVNVELLGLAAGEGFTC